jgi:hypothetical protein
MSLDLALVGFKGQSTAASVFGTLRDHVGSAAPWTSEVAIVEHHGNDRMSVRGTFGSRYVDVEETDHVSAPGAGEGALTGAVVGAIFGPPGFAAGFVLGGIIGAETGKPTDFEVEPELLIDELRKAFPAAIPRLPCWPSPRTSTPCFHRSANQTVRSWCATRSPPSKHPR